jgi:hypothetical protein
VRVHDRLVQQVPTILCLKSIRARVVEHFDKNSYISYRLNDCKSLPKTARISVQVLDFLFNWRS